MSKISPQNVQILVLHSSSCGVGPKLLRNIYSDSDQSTRGQCMMCHPIASKEKLKFYREVKYKKCLKMSDVVMWMGMEQIMEWAYNSPHQSFMNVLCLWWQIVNDDDQTTMWTVTVLGSNSYFYYCHLHLASNRQEIATTSVTKQANLQSTNRSSQKGHFSYKCFHLVSHLNHWIMLWFFNIGQNSIMLVFWGEGTVYLFLKIH